MVHVKIIRHSERFDYKYPHYWIFYFGQYWKDPPLTSNGHLIAKLRGMKMATNNFNPVHIYTSPYIRTMSTATELKESFMNADIVIEPLLSEYQPYTAHAIGLYPNGIPTTYEGLQTEFEYPESTDLFCRRVKYIVQKLIDKNDGDIIIVTHGEIIKYYINHLLSMYPDLQLKYNTSVPYLSTVSFDFDKTKHKIVKESISIDTN